jgi:hypothetical protein
MCHKRKVMQIGSVSRHEIQPKCPPGYAVDFSWEEEVELVDDDIVRSKPYQFLMCQQQQFSSVEEATCFS